MLWGCWTRGPHPYSSLCASDARPCSPNPRCSPLTCSPHITVSPVPCPFHRYACPRRPLPPAHSAGLGAIPKSRVQLHLAAHCLLHLSPQPPTGRTKQPAHPSLPRPHCAAPDPAPTAVVPSARRRVAELLAPLWCPVPALGPAAPTTMEGGQPMLQWRDLSSPVQWQEANAVDGAGKAPMLMLRRWASELLTMLPVLARVRVRACIALKHKHGFGHVRCSCDGNQSCQAHQAECTCCGQTD